jgi:hypothetical protein
MDAKAQIAHEQGVFQNGKKSLRYRAIEEAAGPCLFYIYTPLELDAGSEHNRQRFY